MESNWSVELDDWLADLGRFVFEQVKFKLALMGFEVDFPTISTTELRISGVPATRSEDYLLPRNNKLEWFPRSSG